MLGLDSPTAHWATFLVICGVGTGMAINLPYTIVQEVTAFQFMFQLGAALSLSIGQTIFLSRLKASAQIRTPSISSGDLISSGASHLTRLAGGSEEFYNSLRQVYMDALHDTYIFPIVVTGVALIITIIVENKNIKKVAKDRESHAQD
ncbi:hypothetical protein QBC37DRAFT_436144 [Rhypophila decipiens]|uniref:Uncharacterized protein n=1 Tax=Rhypophila decipiens TaxID=261697 RepID=A0AAN7BDU7_9PEZI|nr:hypothetical protein QBC37DRAFT_436144 [Rhypophila decipiens]